MILERYSLRAQCGYKKPLEEVYVPKMETLKASLNIKKDIYLKFRKSHECYYLFTCGKYNSSLKKCIFLVQTIFQ